MGRIVGTFNGSIGSSLTLIVDYNTYQNIETNVTDVYTTMFVQINRAGTSTNKQSVPYSMSIGGVGVAQGSVSFNVNNIPVGGTMFVANGYRQIPHNDAGYLGSFEIAGAFDLSGTSAGYGYASQYISVPDIPRASQPSLITYPSSTYDITIGTEIYIHTNAKSDIFRHKVYLEFLGYTRLIAENIQYNTIWNTNDDATEMYKKIPNSNNGVGRIKLETYNGNQLIGTKYVEFRANITDANPIFNNFTFENTNTLVNSLTGNNQIIVNKYSDIKATISVANKAEAQKYATMSRYRLVVGSKQVEGNYSSSADVSLTVSDIDSNIITVYAIDSRGNSTSKQLTPSTFLNYTEPIIKEFKVERQDGGTSETVRISGNGTYWNKNFGKVLNDVTATYQFRQAGASEWINGTTTITLTKSNERFSFDLVIASNAEDLGFNIENSYEIKVIITDKLSSVEDIEIIGSGKPTMALHKNGVAINSAGGYNENLGGSLQVDGEIVVGKSIITAKPSANIISENNNLVKSNLIEKEKIGNSFKVEDGSIIVGKNTNYIIVCATSAFNQANNGYVGLNICINDESVVRSVSQSENSYLPNLSISNHLLSVKENDKISLKFSAEKRMEMVEDITYITVERVA